MSTNPARPLSPHLQVYKWGPAMAASIINRVTGVGLAIFGVILMTWWLAALASGPESYAHFLECIHWKLGPVPVVMILPIGLTWAFFQHLAGGIRHFVLDTGAGFELKANRTWAIATFTFAIVMTALVWMCIYAKGAA